MDSISRVERQFRPGTQQLYSCLNFITLQNILQAVTGERLCDYAQREVFDALGLASTCYFPLCGEAPSKAGAAALGMTPALGWRLFLGDVNGCIGETSALALLLGGAYLLARKVIPWQTPLAFIGTVAVGATIIHAVSPATQMPASFHLLTGGLLLGA